MEKIFIVQKDTNLTQKIVFRRYSSFGSVRYFLLEVQKQISARLKL